MNWKTAVNILSTVSTMFADATTAKSRTLRVLEGNPALGVRPPDKGEETATQSRRWEGSTTPPRSSQAR
jgi:hypothetical protein